MDSVDFGRALKAPFNDKGWPMKTLLGFLWGFLVVTAPAVYGAQIEYTLRVANGNEELPDWSDFGSKWVKGFMVILAGMIYSLPITILGAILILPGMISAFMSGDSNAIGGLLAGGSCLFILVATVYWIALWLFFSAATVHYAVKGTFGAFFQFGEILAHIRDGSGYFAAWLWSVVVGMAIGVMMSIVSGVTGGVGGFLYPAATYLMVMITSHLFGQWAARSYGFPGLGGAAPAYGAPPAPGGYAPPAPPAAPPAYAPPAPPAYTPPAPPAAPQGSEAPAAPPAYAPPAPATPPAPPAAPPAPDAAFSPPAPPAPVVEPVAPPAAEPAAPAAEPAAPPAEPPVEQ